MLRKLKDKRIAKKLWREGREIGLIPCKCRPGGMWVSVCWVQRDRYADHIVDYYKNIWPELDLTAAAWEAMYNNYSYYNLGYWELGYYAHYYVREGVQ